MRESQPRVTSLVLALCPTPGLLSALLEERFVHDRRAVLSPLVQCCLSPFSPPFRGEVSCRARGPPSPFLIALARTEQFARRTALFFFLWR